VEIDGSRYSGSGTIVRQAVALAALTGQPVHIVNARIRRLKPGLQPQHIRVVEAIRELAEGTTEGVARGSQELIFRPGNVRGGASRYLWDIGSAGSTTLLALAALPVLAFASRPVEAELRGGIFQDFAPSFYHLRHAMLPVLQRMGIQAEIEMQRPGYVPRGGGILRVTTSPVEGCLRSIIHERPGQLESITGIALASHLQERRVARRMAEAAQTVLAAEGYRAEIDIREDTEAVQAGAALALFANLPGGWRLGADWAGAKGRPAETIGERVSAQLLQDLRSGATLDHFAADQIITFAALADGESRFRIPAMTEHIESNAWLVREFLGARVEVEGQILSVHGVGFRASASIGTRRAQAK
jgi:RNA 3'-terminal phosphate cyclase (ATP)